MLKITENTLLSEILKHEGAEKILKKYKLPCLQCPFAKMEMESLKIGQVCRMYDIDLENLLRELNRCAKS